MDDRRRLAIVATLGSLTALGPLTVDLYLPALPAIRAAFATTAAGVQLTITGTLLGMALGNLVIGPLSDVLGRRRPLLVGLLVYVVASALCTVTPSIAALAALRVVQGVGVATAGVIATAILRDLFSDAAFARMLSRLLVVPTAAPIVAPTLGGFLLRWTRWEGVFVALAVIGVLLAGVVAFGLRETLPARLRRPARAGATGQAYRALAKDRTFVYLILVAGLAMAALLAYVAGSSFVLQEQYGLTAQQFGLLFGAAAIGLVGATQLNVWLLRRFSSLRILAGATTTGAAAGLVLLYTASTGFGGLPGLLAPLWVTIATVGLVFPNAPAVAMSRHGEMAGSAAALLGAAQFGIGGAAAPVVGLLGTGKVAMALVVAVAMLAAAATTFAVVRRTDRTAPAEAAPAPAMAGR